MGLFFWSCRRGVLLLVYDVLHEMWKRRKERENFHDFPGWPDYPGLLLRDLDKLFAFYPGRKGVNRCRIWRMTLDEINRTWFAVTVSRKSSNWL